jgi:hypothetical protein
MTSETPDPQSQPAPNIIKFPTHEEISAAFAPYVAAIGTVAHASNYLHERLAQLFVIVSGADRPIALAMWYSLTSDRSQRGILRAAISASPEDRWKPALPLARSDLLWLIDRANHFGNTRNDAIHTPCSLFTSAEGHGMGAAFLNGNPNAARLKGREIVKEFELCADFADKLIRFAERIQTALSFPADYAWPDKPELPDLLPKNNP